MKIKEKLLEENSINPEFITMLFKQYTKILNSEIKEEKIEWHPISRDKADLKRIGILIRKELIKFEKSFK